MPTLAIVALAAAALVAVALVVRRARAGALPAADRPQLETGPPSQDASQTPSQAPSPAGPSPVQAPAARAGAADQGTAAPSSKTPTGDDTPQTSADPADPANAAVAPSTDDTAPPVGTIPAAVEERPSAPLFAPPAAAAAPPTSGLGLPPLNLSSRPAAPAPQVTPTPVALPREKPRVAAVDLDEERARMRKGLARTRKGFVARLADLVRGKPKVSDDLKDDIEEVLFTADIGTTTAQKLLDGVTEVLDRAEVADPDAVWSVINHTALDMLESPGAGSPAISFPVDAPPYVLLMIGVNGVGKTTTLGKLASRHVAEGRKVLLVAGDTFRAAAREQLDVWARRVGCDIHFGREGADPSSVIFDGITHAREHGHDVVLCDTAGRLHTKKELMDELAKIRRSAGKAMSQGQSDERWPHDTFLVLDATIGQNALSQAVLFKETMEFTGLVLTKLDGTAKGGVVLGVCDELKVPIRHIGIGEGIDDLRDFDAKTFADALFDRPDT